MSSVRDTKSLEEQVKLSQRITSSNTTLPRSSNSETSSNIALLKLLSFKRLTLVEITEKQQNRL